MSTLGNSGGKLFLYCWYSQVTEAQEEEHEKPSPGSPMVSPGSYTHHLHSNSIDWRQLHDHN
jgi:hypothetical protein